MDDIRLFVFVPPFREYVPFGRVLAFAIFKTPAGEITPGDVDDGFDLERSFSDGINFFDVDKFDDRARIVRAAFALGFVEGVARQVV